MYELKCVQTKDLTKKNIKDICKLKNQYWTYTIKEQLEWFKVNVKPSFVHICLFLKGKLIGYTLLASNFYKNKENSFKFYLIDTVVITESFRKKKLSNLLMSEINLFLKERKKLGLLICDPKMVKFYEKYSWKTFNIKKFKLNIDLKNKKSMVFNYINNNN